MPQNAYAIQDRVTPTKNWATRWNILKYQQTRCMSFCNLCVFDCEKGNLEQQHNGHILQDHFEMFRWPIIS